MSFLRKRTNPSALGVIDKRPSPIIFRKVGASWNAKTSNTYHFFEPTSKRRKGFPSEKKVKRGVRIVHGEKGIDRESSVEMISVLVGPAVASRSAA